MRVPGQYGDIKLLAGTACGQLSQEIADYLTTTYSIPVTLLEREIYKFKNDNTFVQLGESTRGQDVYIIQSMDKPVNDCIMELLITMDAVRRDSAGRITAVIPYMSYTRTDKKDLPRTPITARLIADMIEVAGADRWITVDLHALQIQGFFTIPGDVLTASHIMQEYVEKNVDLSNLTVCTVDLGFAKGGRNWAHALGTPVAFVEKKRTGAVATAMSIVGNVEGRDILLVDDEVDTGGSLVRAIELLDSAGAKRITVAFSHPVFSEPALDRLAAISYRVEEFIFTNTLYHPPGELLPNMTVLSVAELLGEVIRRAHQGISVGAMFQD